MPEPHGTGCPLPGNAGTATPATHTWSQSHRVTLMVVPQGQEGTGQGNSGLTPTPCLVVGEGHGTAGYGTVGPNRAVATVGQGQESERGPRADTITQVMPGPQVGGTDTTLQDRGTRVGQQAGGGDGATEPPYVWVGALGDGGEGEVVVVQLGRGAVSARGEQSAAVRPGTPPRTPHPRGRFGVNPVLGGSNLSVLEVWGLNVLRDGDIELNTPKSGALGLNAPSSGGLGLNVPRDRGLGLNAPDLRFGD